MPDWTKFNLEYSKEYRKKASNNLNKIINLKKD